METPKQVLVISVKDTELTAVLPLNKYSMLDVVDIGIASNKLFEQYLDGFTTLSAHKRKAYTIDLNNYFNTVVEEMDKFSTDPSIQKKHLMQKIKDVEDTTHNFCLCYQRIPMS